MITSTGLVRAHVYFSVVDFELPEVKGRAEAG